MYPLQLLPGSILRPPVNEVDAPGLVCHTLPLYRWSSVVNVYISTCTVCMLATTTSIDNH